MSPLATVGSNPTLSARVNEALASFHSANSGVNLVRFFRRKSPKVGLALSSGAARGLAHIGVLKALREASVPVDMIAGTSMGAMIGACFAREGEITAFEEIALNTGWRELARLLDPSFGSLGKGLIRGQRIEALLRSVIGGVEFKDLKIPFVAIATDINTGREVVIRNGSVVEAVRASISIPGIFVPVALEDRCLVDGGLTNPVPTDVLQAMGAKLIVAVNVLVEPLKSRRAVDPSKEGGMVEVPNIFNTLIQSIYIMEYEIIKARIVKADIVISPDVSHIEAFEFHRGEEAILAGYEAARKVLSKLGRLTGRR